MNGICGECPLKDNCMCDANSCRTCTAADYIKLGGVEKYCDFKRILLNEINFLLKANNIPEADRLCELQGSFVNLAYPVPSGKKVKFLDDTRVYLGAQIEFADLGVCYGVVADTTFILICSYSVNGSEAELIVYKKR